MIIRLSKNNTLIIIVLFFVSGGIMKHKLLTLFEEISAIPHVSYHEKALSDMIYNRAKNLNYECYQDEMDNLFVRVPATEGYEDSDVVMIQSHLDMVGEKNNDSSHNFETEGIELIVEGNILKANKTTLGADDGVGVAYMIALMEDQTLSHPELELVFTVQEEVGLVGATYFDTTNLKAKQCIGLDSSGENEVYVSSSGGVRTKMVKKLEFEDKEMDTVIISITGLLGGHSGGDIDKERANALRLVGIILKRSIEEYGSVYAVDIQGGLKINAIPREATLELAVDDTKAYMAWFESIAKEIKFLYEHSDKDLHFHLETSSTNKVINKKHTMGMANALFMLPQGVMHKSMVIEDLVIASGNIGTANVIDDEFIIAVSLRATQEFVIDDMMYRIKLISKNTGYEFSYTAKYPGWNYEKDSKLRSRLFKIHKALRNNEMKEVATHGGVELGIWKGKMPHLDIVGIGPIMHDIHTPNERLELDSYYRTYEIIVKLLEDMK